MSQIYQLLIVQSEGQLKYCVYRREGLIKFCAEKIRCGFFFLVFFPIALIHGSVKEFMEEASNFFLVAGWKKKADFSTKKDALDFIHSDN